MLEFFQTIFTFLETIWSLVLMVCQSIINWISFVPRFILYINAFFAWMPQPFAMFAVMGLSFTVLLFLLGRV